MVKGAGKYAGWDRYRKGKKHISAWLEPELKAKLAARAADLDVSMATLIAKAIEDLLQSPPPAS